MHNLLLNLNCDAVKTCVCRSYPDHKFKRKGKGGGGLAEIKRKRKVVLIIFAEVCWIFVSEGYIG